MNTPKIVIRNLNFYYGNQQVIHDLHLSIPAREILSVLGPANSGITTLLMVCHLVALRE